MLKIFAHRGASAVEPENTLAAFRAAVAAGADGVELDVRRCATGELVVHHDAILEAGSALIHTNYAELPDYIPLLSSALVACGPLTINVEIKNTPTDPDFDAENHIVSDVVRVVKELGLQPQVIISSFNLSTLNEVKRQEPSMITAWLLARGSAKKIVKKVIAYGHEGLHPHHSMINAEFMRLAQQAERFVNVWTVDEPTEILRLLRLGVNGIITNNPAVTLSVVQGQSD